MTRKTVGFGIVLLASLLGTALVILAFSAFDIMNARSNLSEDALQEVRSSASPQDYEIEVAVRQGILELETEQFWQRLVVALALAAVLGGVWAATAVRARRSRTTDAP